VRALARTDLGGVREILMRSIAREPTARYPSAAEMERALALELSRRYPGFTPTLLANAVRGEVAAREARRALTPRPRAPSADTTFAMHTLIDQPALGPALQMPFAATQPAGSKMPIGHGTATMIPVRHRGVARRRRRVAALTAGGAAAALGASIAIAVAVKDDPPAAPPAVPALVAIVAIDAGAPAAAPASPPDAAPAAPAADAGAPPARPASRTGGGRKTPRTAAPRDPGFVSISASPWGAVYIDGKRVAGETPLYRFPLPAGRHDVRVFFKEAKVFSERRVVELRPGQHRSIGFER
jgi:hypothetical protein